MPRLVIRITSILEMLESPTKYAVFKHTLLILTLKQVFTKIYDLARANRFGWNYNSCPFKEEFGFSPYEPNIHWTSGYQNNAVRYGGDSQPHLCNKVHLTVFF